MRDYAKSNSIQIICLHTAAFVNPVNTRAAHWWIKYTGKEIYKLHLVTDWTRYAHTPQQLVVGRATLSGSCGAPLRPRPLQLTNSPSCTLISCIQVPNHTSTYTCSTLSLHSPEYWSRTPVASLTCTAFTFTRFIITHTCHSPYIYLTLPSLRCLVSHFNG